MVNATTKRLRNRIFGASSTGDVTGSTLGPPCSALGAAGVDMSKVALVAGIRPGSDAPTEPGD
jgi:hypothetical protein